MAVEASLIAHKTKVDLQSLDCVAKQAFCPMFDCDSFFKIIHNSLPPLKTIKVNIMCAHNGPHLLCIIYLMVADSAKGVLRLEGKKAP